MDYKKPMKLNKLLKKEGKQASDVISWRYYAYGIFSCEGANRLDDLPTDVSLAKCFKKVNDTYYLEGAL